MALPTKEQDLLGKDSKNDSKKKDTFGGEMEDDARIWRIYATAAQKHDTEQLTQWNGTLDALLIFAGLFSAVTTTFIIDSYKQMEPDYSKETFQLLLAHFHGKPYVETPASVEESARAINCLWISSLIASLSTALIAILAKQWLTSYPVPNSDNFRQWTQLRQFRFDALDHWHLPVLIAVVPALLHLSLILFLAGLVLFLWEIDIGTAVLAFVLTVATFALYGFTTLSPVVWTSSPYRTPLTPVLQRSARWCQTLPRLVAVALRSGRRQTYGVYDLLLFVLCPFIWRPSGSIPVIATPAPALPQHRQNTLDDAASHRRSSDCHDPWLTQDVIAPNTVAGALSWLSETSDDTDIHYAILHALGDVSRGAKIAPHLSLSLRNRIELEMATIASGSFSARELSQYFRAAVHFESSNALRALVPRIEQYTAGDFHRMAGLADSVIRARCRAGHPWFGVDQWDILCNDPSILPGTARLAIKQLLDHAEEFERREREFVRERLLVMINSWHSHFAADFTPLLKCLKYGLDSDMRGFITRSESSRIPVCAGNHAYCDILDHIAALLSLHQFTLTSDLGRTLKSRTFETLASLCTLHGSFLSHRSVTDWLGTNNALLCISLTSQHVCSLFPNPQAGPDIPIAALRNMLLPDLSWHAAQSHSTAQSLALDTCCRLAVSLLNNYNSAPLLDGVTPCDLAREGCLEPLSRGPNWYNLNIVGKLARALVWLTEATRSRQATLAGDASYVKTCLTAFISSGTSDSETGTERWNLVPAASQQIIYYANDCTLDGAAFYEDLRRLCGDFIKLQELYPEESCWRDIAKTVKQGAAFLNSDAWKARDRFRADIASTLRTLFAMPGAEEP